MQSTLRQVPQRKTFCQWALQGKGLAKGVSGESRGGAEHSPFCRTRGQRGQPQPLLPHAHQLQVGILADLGRTQWVSSVNC